MGQAEHEQLMIQLSRQLSAKRFEHSLQVSQMAASLAVRHGAAVDAAILAGALHDCARAIPQSELLAAAEAAEIPIDAVSRAEPILLHAPLGAVIARQEYGIHDPLVLQAIARHTVGGPGMTTLDKIIYLADMIEPGRAGDLEELRQLAWNDLDAALLLGYDLSIHYVLSHKGVIHPDTIHGRNQLVVAARQKAAAARSEGAR